MKTFCVVFLWLPLSYSVAQEKTAKKPPSFEVPDPAKEETSGEQAVKLEFKKVGDGYRIKDIKLEIMKVFVYLVKAPRGSGFVPNSVIQVDILCKEGISRDLEKKDVYVCIEVIRSTMEPSPKFLRFTEYDVGQVNEENLIRARYGHALNVGDKVRVILFLGPTGTIVADNLDVMPPLSRQPRPFNEVP